MGGPVDSGPRHFQMVEEEGRLQFPGASPRTFVSRIAEQHQIESYNSYLGFRVSALTKKLAESESVHERYRLLSEQMSRAQQRIAELEAAVGINRRDRFELLTWRFESQVRIRALEGNLQASEVAINDLIEKLAISALTQREPVMTT